MYMDELKIQFGKRRGHYVMKEPQENGMSSKGEDVDSIGEVCIRRDGSGASTVCMVPMGIPIG